MIKTIKVTCPYCQCKFNHLVDDEGDCMICCPEDEYENACGEQFFIKVHFRTEIKVFKLVEVAEW